MDTRKLTTQTGKIVHPLILEGAILYWMYRDFDFGEVRQVLLHEMNWTWMLLSMPFGITAQLFARDAHSAGGATGGPKEKGRLRSTTA